MASIKNRCIPVALQSKNVLLIGDKVHIPNKNKCDIIILKFFSACQGLFY